MWEPAKTLFASSSPIKKSESRRNGTRPVIRALSQTPYVMKVSFSFIKGLTGRKLLGRFNQTGIIKKKL
jgi:hypothetical protein